MRVLLVIATKNLLRRYLRQKGWNPGQFNRLSSALEIMRSSLSPRGANLLWHHKLALQIAAPFGAVRQTGLALFHTLESA